jgi:hypothetical protein
MDTTNHPIHPFTRRGIRWCVFYHGLLAALCFIATAGAVGFGFLASRTALFLAASLVGLALTSLYLAVSVGLFEFRPWARTAGIFLAIAGIGLAMFVLLAALVPMVHSLQISPSFWILILLALALYGFLCVADVTVALFLISPRTIAVFSESASMPAWPDAASPLELLLARYLHYSA